MRTCFRVALVNHAACVAKDLTLIKLVRTTAADFGEGFGEVVG